MHYNQRSKSQLYYFTSSSLIGRQNMKYIFRPGDIQLGKVDFFPLEYEQ